MRKATEMAIVFGIIALTILFIALACLNSEHILPTFDAKHTLEKDGLFLLIFCLSLAWICLFFHAITNAFFTKCFNCKKRGLVKRVTLSCNHGDVRHREYSLCFNCRKDESWRQNEQLLLYRNYSVIYVPLL